MGSMHTYLHAVHIDLVLYYNRHPLRIMTLLGLHAPALLHANPVVGLVKPIDLHVAVQVICRRRLNLLHQTHKAESSRPARNVRKGGQRGRSRQRGRRGRRDGSFLAATTPLNCK